MFLILTTDVNGIHCVKSAKERKYEKHQHCQNILNLLLFWFCSFVHLFMYIYICIYIYICLFGHSEKKSSTRKKKNMLVWVTNTVTVLLINALPIFD